MCLQVEQAEMKRIIEGATYNTDTATEIASGSWSDVDRGVTEETTLYQNRAGVFFAVTEVRQQYRDRHDDVQHGQYYVWDVVGDADGARELCEREELTILRDIADMPPEAVGGEPSATLYFRVPPALKAAVDARAKADGVSTNVFGLRCIEQCLKGQLKVVPNV
jgi:hypothetical protein